MRRWLVALCLLLGATAPPAHADILGARPASLSSEAERAFHAGLSALRAGDAIVAEQAFHRSILLDATAAPPYLGLAELALTHRDTKQAAERMRQALALAPNNSSLQTTWSAYLYGNANLPDAEAALRQASAGAGIPARDRTQAVARTLLGDVYLVAFASPEQAIVQYRAATALDPGHAGAHYALGVALMRTAASGADAPLTMATRLAPQSPLPWHALGRLYASEKRYPRALDAFDAALKIHPRFPAAHLERGRVLEATGDDVGALRAYGEVQRYDPTRSIGLTNIAMLQERRRDWPAAERAYLAAVRLEPSNAVAYNNLASMAADRRVGLDQALIWARRAVALAPAVPEFTATLGLVHRARDEMPEAVAALRRAAAVSPRRAVAVYTLGRVLVEAGHTRDGLESLRQALDLDASFPGADDARAVLQKYSGWFGWFWRLVGHIRQLRSGIPVAAP
jgi:tetratricopeptide (TPR) repeat protein